MKRTAVFLALAPAFLAVSSLSLAQQAAEKAAPLPLLTAAYAGAPHLALSHGSWSPDSSRFVFFATGEKDGGHAGDLMQLDPATGKITVLLAKAKLERSRPRLLPVSPSTTAPMPARGRCTGRRMASTCSSTGRAPYGG
ncbi:MAG: hypothetical protein ACR2JE_14290 [Acidobacteriaceae bacterium]